MRKQRAAANWKMNCTLPQAEALLNELLAADFRVNDAHLAIIGVPFPYLMLAKEKLANKANVYVAAQNCSNKKSGAFTGETSAEMLQSIGIDYVIIGHSERREYFNENDDVLAEKIDLALANNLTPIFCCGEPLTIREAEKENDYVALQVQESLFHLDAAAIQKIVIAYEPIWAIGTGKTASNQQAQDMHAFIRSVLANQYSAAIADNISILYGGSVKANNAKEIFAQSDVDGGLVGGASLVAQDFAAIINGLK